jgi:hypothetical protein
MSLAATLPVALAAPPYAYLPWISMPSGASGPTGM